MHPEYGCLYIGRAENLNDRLLCHSNYKDDNIDRKYENLLEESIIFYKELQNKAEGVCIEAYYINKFKPLLNKSLKYKGQDSSIQMKSQPWKMFIGSDSKYKKSLYNLKNKNKQLEEINKSLISDIKETKYKLKEANNQLRYMKKHPVKNISDEKINRICSEIDKENKNKIINRKGRPKEISEDEIELMYRLRDRGKLIRAIAKAVDRSIGSVYAYLNPEVNN